MATQRLTHDVRKSVTLGSSAFTHGGSIPREYTCEGEDVSPPLTIRDVPDGAEGLALVMDDADVPRGTFTHWTLWNLPLEPGTHQRRLERGVDPADLGANAGVNDFGDRGYRGPCPPSGTHRYFVRVFAQRERIDLADGATLPELLRALDGNVLAWGELMGTYRKG